ncbi:unnamed protein product [Blepharisma stoltei]|uniref:C2 NT-type domain-containing protein n=1 Tax=Blepharisma stoltei TaxID=1481888 RepID=A0AAU9IEM0_9CILI|nr:unnamed protein product [Blepharisma stoltei]
MAKLRASSPEKSFYELVINIHYIHAQLPDRDLIKIQAKRGNEIQETQPMHYNSTNGSIIFEYPLTFEIPISKYKQQLENRKVKLSMIELRGKKETINGKAEIDVSPLLSGLKLDREEVPLKSCTDKLAIICVSIDLITVRDKRSSTLIPASAQETEEELSLQKIIETEWRIKSEVARPTINTKTQVEEEERDTARSTIISTKGELAMFWEESPSISSIDEEMEVTRRRVARSGTMPTLTREEVFHRKVVEPKSAIEVFTSADENVEQTKTEEDSSEKDNNFDQNLEKSPEVVVIPPSIISADPNSPSKLDEIPTRVKSATISAPISPKLRSESMSPKAKLFLDIDAAKEKTINPRQSMVESEDSSSEEDLVDVSAEILPSDDIKPISILKSVQPNLRSQDMFLEKKELSSGIHSKRSSTCSGCSLQ